VGVNVIVGVAVSVAVVVGKGVLIDSIMVGTGCAGVISTGEHAVMLINIKTLMNKLIFLFKPESFLLFLHLVTRFI
jgi:predicted thioesterase